LSYTRNRSPHAIARARWSTLLTKLVRQDAHGPGERRTAAIGERAR